MCCLGVLLKEIPYGKCYIGYWVIGVAIKRYSLREIMLMFCLMLLLKEIPYGKNIQGVVTPLGVFF